MRFVLCYYQLVCAFLKERVRSQRSEAQLHFINAKHSLRYESGFTYSQPKPKQQKQTAIFPKNGLLWCSYKEGISLCGSEGGGNSQWVNRDHVHILNPCKKKTPSWKRRAAWLCSVDNQRLIVFWFHPPENKWNEQLSSQILCPLFKYRHSMISYIINSFHSNCNLVSKECVEYLFACCHCL